MDFVQRESLLIAPYAMHSANSAGRVHPEPGHPYRSPYQRDRDRILHSSAYRRLSHKTQVFTGELGDYHRTRLTHTLEVASIARTLARALRANEDLVETLALGHDIGHPPFGHAGEEVLDQKLRNSGGFNHNDQAVRIFELLEVRYVQFPGLNLSREVIECQRHRGRHSSPIDQDAPLIEAQIVDAADSIAYDSHDADDALELGMLGLAELRELHLWCEAVDRVEKRFSALTPEQLRRAVIHELIDWQVSDLLAVTKSRLTELRPQTSDELRGAPPVVTSSPEVAEKKGEMERFLFDRVYRHPSVLSHRLEAAASLEEMFARLVARPESLPPPFARIVGTESLPRAVADYLSSVTDRHALEAYRRIIDKRSGEDGETNLR